MDAKPWQTEADLKPQWWPDPAEATMGSNTPSRSGATVPTWALLLSRHCVWPPTCLTLSRKGGHLQRRLG